MEYHIEKRKLQTSRDYSTLSFLELLDELQKACKDLAQYREKMVQECNKIRQEQKAKFERNWEDIK